MVVLEKVNLREDVFKFGKMTEVWLDATADSTLKSLKWGTRTFLRDHIVFLAPSQIIHPHITHKPPHPPVSQIQPQFQLETPAVMWQITSVFQFWNHQRRENSDDFSTLWPEKWRFVHHERGREKKIRAGGLVRIRAPCQVCCNSTLWCKTWTLSLDH